ncbi:protein MAINTENANCE OF PSII UNDER HIGH LIGHT 1 [Aegilops tauschii subsp. strangulata]|uniref:Proline-rich family protein n=3 Tax=Triticinae TaxID=1648030 RepID=A0A452ZCE3_AEGTS|nr:protein MAINTENANCE OF PSII UNDER HIGH LIGHT 1 [Aegilops tauschii subsp. strangulata]XP_044450832.1 protein MAINTENANCE OF PSII UNDER HIGH LIGHT 1-like [Triticum aestivum]
MACPAQSMLSASSCVLLRSSKPQQATIPRGGGGINGGNRFLTLSCNASSSPDDSECNDVECAPEKEVGSLSVEWLAEERTKVVGTFPPKKKGWTGLVEKDTAGQTNIYSIEPAVYVAESAISSGTAGTSSDGSENTAALTGGLALIFVAGAASILIQVSKNQPPVQTQYSGPPLSYYVAKFQPAAAAFSVQSSPPVVEAAAPEETPSESDSPTLEAETSATAEQPSS